MKTPNKSSVYKVYFKSLTEVNQEKLNLTFFDIMRKKFILDTFPTFLIKYNDLTRRKKNTNSLGNIKEIITLGNTSKSKITQFFVLLYTEILSNKTYIKKGILIGNHKEKGYLILGLWPYSEIESNKMNFKNYDAVFSNIIENSEKFKDIMLIT